MTIIDMHAHILPDKLSEKGAGTIGAFYGVPMIAPARLDTYLEYAAEADITLSCVHSVATASHQTPRVNDFTASIVQKYPGRIIGFGTMHADTLNMPEEAERALSMGLLGFKLHPDMQYTPLDDERLFPFYETIEGRVPLMAHTGDRRFDYSNPNRVKHLLELFPRLTLIGAHFGGWSVWQEAARELAGHPRLYVDCSSSLFFLPLNEALACVRAYGADRVMFGTDFPMWSPKEELSRLENIGLTANEMESVLHKTAEALLGIGS